MKKWSLFFLCALLSLMPLSATAEDLPEILGAVSQGLSEGIREGAQALGAAGQDLSLTLTAQDARIEEGRTLLMTVTAGNPYPLAMPVTLTLDLPARLSCAQPATWEAQLEAASVDPQSGALVPSVTTFTREVTLLPGSGDSEQAKIQVEMSMGSRFYRANTALDLCVPLVSASASIVDAQEKPVQPGDSFVFQIDVVNAGDAPKDVNIDLALPDGVSPAGLLPAGFSLKNRTVSGAIRAEIASAAAIRLPLTVEEDALEGDADASRLIAGILTVDGKRVSAPMLRVVGPMISAKLIPELDSLEEGRMMDLSITVVNTGLAPANVELSCLLPEGLSVVEETGKATAAMKEEDRKERKAADAHASDGEADDQPPLAAMTDDGGIPPDTAAEMVMSGAAIEPQTREEDGALIYTLHMDAAKETESGVAAATKEVRLRVRADMPVENVGDRLLGASLAWRTEDGDTTLGEAAALRVYRQGFLGMSDAEWNGVLLAALLMMVTICCLYSAVKSDSKPEEYCFE